MSVKVKIIWCVLSWLTLSPLFLYLTNRWGMLKKWLRIVLMLISPLFIVIYALVAIGLFIVIVVICPDFFSIITRTRDDYYFSNPKRIERITDMKFDIDRVISYEPGEKSFLGDYDSTTRVLLNERPDYVLLDSLVKTGKWSRTSNSYYFSAIWGNEIPAPPGEPEGEDRTLTITVPLDSDTIIIGSGKW